MHLTSVEYKKLLSDANLYLKQNGQDEAILAVTVDYFAVKLS